MTKTSRTILALNKTYLVDELRQLGHTVYTAAIPESFSFASYELTSKRQFDLPFERGIRLETLLRRFPSSPAIDTILYFDDSSPNLHVTGIENASCPTVFLSVDAHLHSHWHPMLAGMFDYCLVAQKDYLPLFLANCPQSTWFPLWASRDVTPHPKKSIDACFRGALDKNLRPRRVAFLEELSSYVPVDIEWQDYTIGFPSSRIVVNETLRSDLNFRVFEAMMCGALLVTPKTTNGLLDLFQDGVHLVTYEEGNAKDAADKIKYFLEHETERATIAAAGHAEVVRAHRGVNRAAAIEVLLPSLGSTARPHAARGKAAQALLDASLAMGKLPKEIDQKLLTSADALSNAQAHGDQFDEAFASLTVMCLTLLEQRGLSQTGIDLVSRLYGNHPMERSMLLTLVALLDRCGKSDLASQTAAAFSDDSKALIEEARNYHAKVDEDTAHLREVLERL